MSMTVAITRNVPGRFRGFLSSCMLELAPGIYLAPRLRKPVRDRVWAVLVDWAAALPADAGVCMFWRSRKAPSGLAIRMIGFPKKELVDHEGVWLSSGNLTSEHELDELEALAAWTDETPSSDTD